MLNASQQVMKRAALSAESTNSTPPLKRGWEAITPTRTTVDAREAGDQLTGEQPLDLEEGAGVHQGR